MAKEKQKEPKEPPSGPVIKDSRFAKIQRDPRFQLPRKSQVKESLDDRFKNALKSNDVFEGKAHTDRYGRKLEKVSEKSKLKRYTTTELDSSSEEDGKRPDMAKLMRGEQELSSSDESSEDSEQESDLDEDTSQDQQDAEPDHELGDPSSRLAVVNLDWDNVSANDLLVVFSSFVGKNSRVVSVKIYPSEYGKKMMAQEELQGPPKELFESKPKKEERQETEFDENKDYSSSKLRKYQLQRLQYYYAVVVCQDVETAKAIYTQCDGAEYESSANFFDLRFIPDGMEFDDEPKDSSTRLPTNYKPSSFVTDALQHSQVKLTWDETPQERIRMASKAFNRHEIEDMDLQAYLASGSDSDDDNINKLRSLVSKDQADFDGESDVDMEITFNSALDGKEGSLEVQAGAAAKDDAEDGLTTIERYRLKEKERRKKRMEKAKAKPETEAETRDKKQIAKEAAELELMAMDDDINAISNEPAQVSGKKQRTTTKRAAKKKALAEAEKSFDSSDTRFQNLFEDPDYAIDVTAPQFKKTEAMEKVLSERRTRIAKAPERPSKKKHQPKDEDLSELVQRIKRKKTST